MTLLTILEFPDPRLRTKAVPVTRFDAALARLAKDMLETMYAAPGIGLAASQVDQPIQMLVLDVSDEKNAPMVIINPRIVASEGRETCQEGCLSVPGIFADVRAEAERFVHNRLGSAGEPICEAIARCRNPQELRALLPGVEVFVGQRLDAATTQAFARHFGSLLL